jgi:hypothetical protein
MFKVSPQSSILRIFIELQRAALIADANTLHCRSEHFTTTRTVVPDFAKIRKQATFARALSLHRIPPVTAVETRAV